MTTDSMFEQDNVQLMKAAIHEGLLKSLTGQVVCFTGTMGLKREEMEALVNALGGQTTRSISNHTTLLVAADTTTNSSKAVTARVQGVRVIDEAAFIRMINGD